MFPPRTPWVEPQDVVSGIAEVEEVFRSRGDRRAVFATAYGLITREIVERANGGTFEDAAWVERYLVAFAELYRSSLCAHLEGDFENVAQPWRIAFDVSSEGRGLVIQDLLLGINAHIRHDLPLALEKVGVDPSRRQKYVDHTRVNEALEATTGRVQDQIAEYYARGLGVLDDLLLFLDEEIAQVAFRTSREEAWSHGCNIAEAVTPEKRAEMVRALETNASLSARRIIEPNGRMPWLIDFLGYLENRFPWPLQIDAPEMFALAPDGGVDDPIDKLIRDLAKLMGDLDAGRNRLSIYVTTYLRNTRKVKEVLENGEFKDPAWMKALDVRFGEMYLAYIRRYQDGATRGLPRCWRIALQEVALGETTIVQDALLQVIPRVVYDLPIALHAVGMETNLEARRADYESTYALFLVELDRIQTALAKKYSPVLRVMDIVGGRLDEWATDRLYRKAREAAWEDALRLENAPDDSARQEIIAELDQRAVEAISSFSRDQGPIVREVARAVRVLEDRFPGDWQGEI